MSIQTTLAPGAPWPYQNGKMRETEKMITSNSRSLAALNTERIRRALQHGPQSTSDLKAITGLAGTAIHQRIRKMVKNGEIEVWKRYILPSIYSLKDIKK